MDQTSLNSERIKKYAVIVSDDTFQMSAKSISLEDRKEMHIEQLGRISNFFNYCIIGKHEKPYRVTPECPMIFGFAKSIYDKLIFIEKKIWQLKEKKYNENVETLKAIIAFMLKNIPSKETDPIIYINDSQLFSDLKEEPTKIQQLRKLYEKQTQMLTLLSPPNSELSLAKLELTGVIESLADTIDPDTSYMPPTTLQTSFDKLIMSSAFPYGKTFAEIIKGFNEIEPQVFVSCIFDIIESIIKFLNISKQFADSALSFLIYRFIFDEVYPKNKYFVDFKPDNEKIAILRQITNAELQLPLQFCPPIDLNKTPAETFRYDEQFGKGVSKIEEMMMYNNPFDILAVAVQTISLIEKAATCYDAEKTLVFPFEVTFTLFIALVLGSSINNLTEIANFVDEYTPQSGLCPQFEYARAKLLASSVQLDMMVEERRNV